MDLWSKNQTKRGKRTEGGVNILEMIGWVGFGSRDLKTRNSFLFDGLGWLEILFTPKESRIVIRPTRPLITL